MGLLGQPSRKWEEGSRHSEAHTMSRVCWVSAWIIILTHPNKAGRPSPHVLVQEVNIPGMNSFTNMNAKQIHCGLPECLPTSWIWKRSHDSVTLDYVMPIRDWGETPSSLTAIFLQQNIGIFSLGGLSKDYKWLHVTSGQDLPPNLGRKKKLSWYQSILGLGITNLKNRPYLFFFPF